MKWPARKPMTLDEIDALEDATGQRHELWHGEPVAMTGGFGRLNPGETRPLERGDVS